MTIPVDDTEASEACEYCDLNKLHHFLLRSLLLSKTLRLAALYKDTELVVQIDVSRLADGVSRLPGKQPLLAKSLPWVLWEPSVHRIAIRVKRGGWPILRQWG